MQERQQPPRLDSLTSEVPGALAMAVERALAIDPRQRYGSAEEMRAALHDGARGIAPERLAADATAATSMLTSRNPTAATRAVAAQQARRLQPTPGPPVYETAEPVPVSYGPRDDPQRRGNAGRILMFALLAALVAGAIAFALGANQGGSSTVQVTPVTGKSTDSIIDQMTRLVQNNTR
jgi:serine/threonine-protein kinase